VRIRQPGVERPDWDFDAEGDEEANECQRLDRLDARAHEDAALWRESRPEFSQRRDAERPCRQADQLGRQQHAQRAANRVDEELGARILPVAAAPFLDQEVDRNQAQLVEQEEDHHILRHEHAHQAGLEQQDQRQMCFGAVDDFPTDQDRQRHEDTGQQHHRRADAVDAQRPTCIDGWEPGEIDDELEA